MYRKLKENNNKPERDLSMYSMIFDTETISIGKPFCYDVGYCIVDTDSHEIVHQHHFIIEQIWHNVPLFATAYYAEKRERYVKLMRGRKAVMTKWGYAMNEMIKDIREYGITDAYAYNSDFDDKVFAFNCDWHKTRNPFDNVAIHDIWGYASQFITCNDDYKAFCEENERFTDSGNYKGSAEVVYQYITNNVDFVEEHMGLYDSQIEWSILDYCLMCGATIASDYKVEKILTRPQKKPFKIVIDGETVVEGEYVKKYVRDDYYKFTM